jgi:hypothetical protein
MANQRPGFWRIPWPVSLKRDKTGLKRSCLILTFQNFVNSVRRSEKYISRINITLRHITALRAALRGPVCKHAILRAYTLKRLPVDRTGSGVR